MNKDGTPMPNAPPGLASLVGMTPPAGNAVPPPTNYGDVIAMAARQAIDERMTLTRAQQEQLIGSLTNAVHGLREASALLGENQQALPRATVYPNPFLPGPTTHTGSRDTGSNRPTMSPEPARHATHPNLLQTLDRPPHAAGSNAAPRLEPIKKEMLKAVQAGRSSAGLAAYIEDAMLTFRKHAHPFDDNSEYPRVLPRLFANDPDLYEFVVTCTTAWRRDIATHRGAATYPEDHVYPKTELAPVETRLIKDVIRFLTSEVRPRGVVALHEVLNGHVTQGTLTAPQYTQQFLRRSRELPNESQQTLCTLFLRGLKPELQCRCLMNKDGERWSCLHDLIQWTFVQEEIADAIKSIPNTYPATSHNPSRPSREYDSSRNPRRYDSSRTPRAPSQEYRGSGTKRSLAAMLGDMDVDTPGLAAATGSHYGPRPFLPDITTYDEALPGDLVKIGGRPDFKVLHEKLLVRPPVFYNAKADRPISECLGYAPLDAPNSARPVLPDWRAGKTNRILDSLIEYGVCRCCRAERHDTGTCTNRPALRGGTPGSASGPGTTSQGKGKGRDPRTSNGGSRRTK